MIDNYSWLANLLVSVDKPVTGGRKTNTTQAEIQQALLTRRDTLQQLATSFDVTVEVSSDDVEHMQSMTRRETDASQLTRCRRDLRQVDAALDRLKKGTWGRCRDCSVPIGVKRLQAMPWADLCLTCQEEEDHARCVGSNRRGSKAPPTRLIA